MKRKSEGLLGMLTAAAAAALVLSFPEQTAQGMNDGIELCLSRVVPSVFPMMLVCVLMVECGLAGRVGRLLSPLSARMFRLPGEGAAAVLMAVTGGYPAGAKAVMELYGQGAVTIQQAARMSLFCFSAGPAFLVGVAGSLAGGPAAGWLLMGVQAVTVILMGMIVCRIKPLPQMDSSAQKPVPSCPDFAAAIVTSVSKSASAMLQVCLYVMIFAAAGSVLAAAGVTGIVENTLTNIGLDERLSRAVIPILLEVTGGCVSSAGAGLPAVAFAVGFGGLSVQLQVLSITGKLGVSRAAFFAARCIQGGLGAVLTALLLKLLPDTAVTASASLNVPGLSGSPQGAVMLVIMCAMCVLCLPQKHNGAAYRRA